eukprot:1149347-Pelagomonas_calceolata.AAC.2
MTDVQESARLCSQEVAGEENQARTELDDPTSVPFWRSPHSEATPEGRCLRGQALWFARFTLLLSQGRCGPLTPPRTLEFGMP